MKRIACLVLIASILSPSVALAQQGNPPPTPLPIEQSADALQAAADAAIANAQAAVAAAQQAALQAAAAKAQAAAARERANALDSQAALSRAIEAEQSAASALDSARVALTQAARAVTALKEAQASSAVRVLSVQAAAARERAQSQSTTDAQAQTINTLAAALDAAKAQLSQQADDLDRYRLVFYGFLAAVLGLSIAVVGLVRRTQPVRVPVSVMEPSPSGLTLDNDTADVVPGATVNLSPALRQHIDRLLNQVG